MTKSEFEAIAKRTITNDQYKAIETLYMSSNLDKIEFVKSIKNMLKAIPEEKNTKKVIIAVAQMPNGTFATYEAEVIDYDISTGKVLVKRTSKTRVWAEINFDYYYTRVQEIA
jgi:hypothetical protein